MAIYAIGDLHLPGHAHKPMNVFGSQWDGHFETICAHWREKIRAEDVVLIPGDISWAMQLEDAGDDLCAISGLPGKKVLLRGNHDYWWSSVTKVRAMLGEDMHVVQNDALTVGGYVICGTRGWTFPTRQQPLSEQDEKIFKREVMRLAMSLEQGRKLSGGGGLVVMTHYPPLLSDGADTAFTDLLEQYPVEVVVYGHLHGAGVKAAFEGLRRGIRYHLVSCDALNFSPLRIETRTDTDIN